MDSSERKPIQGRGSSLNTANRFERLSYEPMPELVSEPGFDEDGAPEPVIKATRTAFFRDSSRSIITRNDSPDVGFEFSVNPYRGCEHGCAYCYARPSHEYLGMSAGIEFESKIIVKENAPDLLRKELLSSKWKPEVIAMSGITDCYQPIEKELKLTRGCLEVLAEFRNPVTLITKNRLVVRDKDILSDLARDRAARVFVTVTTLDAGLCGVLEPRTSRPQARLEAMRELSEAGVPVGVMMAPVIPGLTDHEIPRILKAAKKAGARWAHFTILRLPLSVRPIFEEWVKNHRPEREEKIIHRIQSMRAGKMNDPNFGSRMRGQGVFSNQVKQLFSLCCRKEGLNAEEFELSTGAFRRPGEQLALF